MLRSVYNLLSQATGLGITRNIVDCYATIVRLWEPNDRIFLFGFSRGAYTARCVAGVLGLCGVPTKMKDGATAVRRDPYSARLIAEEAVKGIYQYGSSVRGDPLKPERLEKAHLFREKYRSGNGDGANAVPYFIGVWDTVSTLGAGWLGLSILSIVALCASMWLLKVLWPFVPLLGQPISWLTSLLGALGLAGILYVVASIRFRQPLSLARYRMAFYDTKLNPRVNFARHALSIDENRRDFGRVLWNEDDSEKISVTEGGPERFIQLWFSGIHSDVGGGYAENEARLSDIPLDWMMKEAMSLPHPILVDDRYLRLSPSPGGIQHDERKSTIAGIRPWLRRLGLATLGPDRLGWPMRIRDVPKDAPLHPSVLRRFEFENVVTYDDSTAYRPEALRFHQSVSHYYSKPDNI